MTAIQPIIQSRILSLRDQRVMLDADLAELYGVETRVLVQAVKRNLVRFPSDFMFQLSAEEASNLRSQFVISNAGHGGRRTAPYVFTEQGVAMLSSVLGSPRAIAVNIEIMRTFVKARQLATTHGDLAKRLAELEHKTEALALQHDTLSRNTRAQLKQIFGALRDLMTPPRSGRANAEFFAARGPELGGLEEASLVADVDELCQHRAGVDAEHLGGELFGEVGVGHVCPSQRGRSEERTPQRVYQKLNFTPKLNIVSPSVRPTDPSS